jgi:glycosyltransferase involved in cell wall biosynthesis
VRPRLLVIGRVVAGYTWRLLRELRRCDVDVRAVYRDAPASMGSQFAHESGPEGDVPALNSDRLPFPRAVRFMEAGAADAILVLGGAANLPLLLVASAKKRPGTPVYLFTDANVPHRGGTPREWGRHVLYRALRPLVEEVWTLGPSNESALHQYGMPRQRRLPMYAVDFTAFQQPLAERRPLDSGRIRLLCVARLSREKNLLALCAAIASEAIADRFQLTIVGEGPQRARIERTIRASRAPVRLPGSVPRAQMGAVFADADALVLPSTWEPWGIAVVEALGLGLPVVATPRVGAAVSLAGGGAVVLSQGTDAAALAQALARLAAGLEAFRAAARAGSQRIRDEFGTEAVALRIASVLRSARS